MKKKSPRASARQALAPQAAQLKAVRKLSLAGRYEDAQARVAELRSRYPDFKPLLPLAWEIDHGAGDFLSACLHAWDWSNAALAAWRRSKRYAIPPLQRACRH